MNLEVVPLLKSDDTEEAIFIVDEAHLISDNYHQSVDLRFGSGKLLKDFLEFSGFSFCFWLLVLLRILLPRTMKLFCIL